MILDWAELTDEIIQLLVDGLHDKAVERSNVAFNELGDHYGGISSLIGPLDASATVASHILEHGYNFAGLVDELKAIDVLHTVGSLNAAIDLARAVMAQTVGIENSIVDAMEALVETGEDAAAVCTGVWTVFCEIAAKHRVGVLWCDDELDDDDDDDEEETEDSFIIDCIEEARSAKGSVTALITLVGSAQTGLSHALAETLVSDEGLTQGVITCLSLLGLDGESDSQTVRGVCYEAANYWVEKYLENEDIDVNKDISELLELVEQIAQRLGGGMEAGSEALEYLDNCFSNAF